MVYALLSDPFCEGMSRYGRNKNSPCETVQGQEHPDILASMDSLVAELRDQCGNEEQRDTLTDTAFIRNDG